MGFLFEDSTGMEPAMRWFPANMREPVNAVVPVSTGVIDISDAVARVTDGIAEINQNQKTVSFVSVID
jgi:hypothetical protein